MEFSHKSVLLHETIDYLNIRPDGVYLDGTLGGGGHSSEILKRLGEKGRLTLSPSVGDFEGGLILRRGNIEVNCTIALLVELCRGEMSSAIAGVLFD